MKKILVITALFCVSLSSNIYAQCTPDPAVVTAGIPGLFPTPTEGIDAGWVGVAYSETLTMVVPQDTSLTLPAPIGTITATINSVTITGVTGLPAGLAEWCSPTNCIYLGNSTGCIEFSGTPTTAGTYTVTVTVVVNVDVPIVGATDAPAQDLEYTLTIDSAGVVDIQKVKEGTFEVYSVTPNPSSDQAEIRFTVPTYRDVSFSVHNMIGAVVISKNIYAEKGLNVVSLNAEELNPGVYFVTLTDGTNTFTKRMVVGSR